ncbi:MAG: hypothetical protein NTZ90_12775 [Proteobacteria bacterium]|nr:hypothetical protein [Pseudomonadota bacterium]
MNRGILFCVSILAVSATACGKKSKKAGMAVAVPAVEPVVRAATPKGLIGTSSALADGLVVTNPATSIKSRIFSTGPTEILQILKNVDTTIDGYETRMNGKLVKCLADYSGDSLVDTTPVTFANTVDFDGNGSTDLDLEFTQYLNCTEALDTAGESWRAFGRKTIDGKVNWYVREGGTESSSQAGASAIRVVDGSDEAEVWFRVGKKATAKTQSTALAHLKRSSDGTIEYTHTGSGVGYDCGLHMLSKSNLMYIKVAVDQEIQNQGGTTCATSTAATSKEYCIDGSSSSFTEKTIAECSAAGLKAAAFALKGLDYSTATYDKVVSAFAEKMPSTIATFTTDDPPAK